MGLRPTDFQTELYGEILDSYCIANLLNVLQLEDIFVGVSRYIIKKKRL